MQKGVTGQCLQLCKHDFRANNDTALTLAFSCTDAIIPMLLCGTGNRESHYISSKYIL